METKMEMEKTTLVFVPAPTMGHVLATLEFGLRLLDLKNDIDIEVLLITMPVFPLNDSYIQLLIAAQPRLKISRLPLMEPPPLENFQKSPEKFICDCIDSNIDHVRNSISKIVAASALNGFRVAGVVMDFFATSMVDVVNEFSLSPFVFFTSGAGFLRFMLFLAASKDEGSSPYDLSDPDGDIHGFRNPVPVSVFPSCCFNKEGGFLALLKASKRLKDVKGIMINTFEELEEFPLNPQGGGVSPTLCAVGPVISFNGFPASCAEESKEESMMEWLEEQPDASVVFICFGSGGGGGLVTECQVKEIAEGLERSKQRFLWQMRFPLKGGKMAEDALPEGFKERTKGRGMICGWVKQIHLLGHRAIGGFVSHCGWNSTLESIWHGVPVATLPIAAEQQLNALMMVKELGMSVELKVDYRPGIQHVSAEEVERAVVELMDEQSEVRKKVKEMSVAARKAVSGDGSSTASLLQFADRFFGST